MSLGNLGWARREHMFRRGAQLRLQSIGNSFRNVAFDRENISKFAIVDVGPEMCVGQSVDQLHINTYLIADLLHTAFEDVRHPELFRDLGQIFGSTLETL